VCSLTVIAMNLSSIQPLYLMPRRSHRRGEADTILINPGRLSNYLPFISARDSFSNPRYRRLKMNMEQSTP
ncbi:hypothetical protein BVRB_009810, partial [Beta vulgaris subsp. vulgaris]